MALLKKVKSATLVEALVATVLIVVVFVIASLVLNNLLVNSFSNNTHGVENRIFELQYQTKHGSIIFPYHEEYENWDIELNKEQQDQSTIITARALNRGNSKEINKSVIYEIK